MEAQYIQISKYGNKSYFKNRDMTVLHRTDGPACEFVNGTKQWWIDGKRHRNDGPAIEYANGNKEWWLNGKPNRTDGPSVEWSDGVKAWYINGKNLTEEEFNLRTSPEIVLTLDEIASKLGIDISKLKIKK